MDSFFRQAISKNAGQAAALERRDGGNGYAYAMALLRGILVDHEATASEKVERGRFFLDEFDRRLKGGN